MAAPYPKPVEGGFPHRIIPHQQFTDHLDPGFGKTVRILGRPISVISGQMMRSIDKRPAFKYILSQ